MNLYKYYITVIGLCLVSLLHAQTITIDYTFTAKSTDGDVFTEFKVLKDNGKASLFFNKDTTIKTYERVLRYDKTKFHGLYTDKVENVLLTYAPVFNKDYYLKEDSLTNLFEWTVIDSVKKTILGYDCKLAICKFRGRNYRAFYTESLPFFTGPWKLTGLPGVILEASTTDGMYSFEATKIGINNTNQTIDNPYKNVKGPFIGFVEYKKLFLKKLQAAQHKVQSEEKDDDVTYEFKDNSIEQLK